jgi:cysteine-rich repeat protein
VTRPPPGGSLSRLRGRSITARTTMNPRPGLLACAIVAGCFRPTGSTDTSNPTIPTGLSSSDDAGTDTATSDTGSDSTVVTASTSSATTGDPSTTTTSTGGCGDGSLEPQSEECDDGNQEVGDGCSMVCTKEFRRVFVTSQVWGGDLGGLEGADQKCQDAANSAALPGVYKAWLGTVNASPAESFIHSPVPYRQVDGVEVATDWSDLISGTLNNGIFVSELGGPPGAGMHNCIPEATRPVWTNTNSNGKNNDKDCAGWTGVGTGYSGQAGAITGNWAAHCELDCQQHTAALYCFEQ